MKKTIQWIIGVYVFVCLQLLFSFATYAAATDPATRGDCISNIIIHSNLSYQNSGNEQLDAFTDADEFIGDPSVICAAIEHGILYGYEDGTLRLNEPVTRAEFACMLYRAKDFYETHPTETLTYRAKYTDLSDWNTDAVYYCIENGYMLGYGDVFGAEDAITLEQLDIVLNRMSFGLTTREKHLLFNICGDPKIPVDDILNSAYAEELANVVLPSRDGEHVAETGADVAHEMETMLERVGNMDYERLESESYAEYIARDFHEPWINGIVLHTKISDGNTVQTMDDIINHAKENRIKRESIFVFSPTNNKRSGYYGAYTRTVVTGYEYYCYTECAGQTPQNEQIGVWYKRRVDVDNIQTHTPSSRGEEILCIYGQALPLE